MTSNPIETGEEVIGPPPITPRSSSLQPHLRGPNGTDIPAALNVDSDGESVNSENEKERVREKLKKTSIAGMNAHVGKGPRLAETAGTKSETKGDESSAEVQESDQEMGSNDNKSEVSDASSGSSRKSRKRSRASDDDGEDLIDVDSRPHSRPRAHPRKRSRELSDEDVAKKEARRQREQKLQGEETSAGNGEIEDVKMAHGQISRPQTPPSALPSTTPKEASPPEIQMKEGENRQNFANHESTSPHRKGDGRKRIREEGNLDEVEEVKNKKPIIEEEDSVRKSEEEGVGIVENKDLPSESLQDFKAESQINTPFIERQSSVASKTKSDAKIPPGSGFANTSTKSPFATTATNAKPLFGGVGTGTLFANSKIGQMAGSNVSPFGSLGASTSGCSSPFGALGGGSKASGLTPSPFGSPKPASSPFGILASKSPDILSAAPKVAAPIGAKPVKPFGAPEEHDEEGSDNEDAGGDDTCDDSHKILKNELAQEKERITGEENEIPVCQYRAKLFYFDPVSKAWKERGIGTVKLLSSRIDLNDIADYGVAPDAPTRLKGKIRLVMRADAVHKVILNVPLVAEALSTYGDEKGNAPSNNTFKLMGIEDGKSQPFILKMKNYAEAKALHGHIVELLAGAL